MSVHRPPRPPPRWHPTESRWWRPLTCAAVAGLIFGPTFALATEAAPQPDVDVTADRPTTQRTTPARIAIAPAPVPTIGAVPSVAPEQPVATVTASTPQPTGQRPAPATTTAVRTAVATIVITQPGTTATQTATATVTAAPADCLDPGVECECDHQAHDPALDCDPATQPTAPATSSTPEPTQENPPTAEPEPTDPGDLIDDLLEVVTP